MNKKEVVAAVVGAFVASALGGFGSLWAFSRDVVTKDEAKEVARSIVVEYNGQVLSRLSSLEAKVDILLSRERNERGPVR